MMNTPKSNRHSTTPRRTFGADDSALDDTDTTPTRSALRRAIPRISFGSLHRPSFRFKNSSDNEDGAVVSPTADKAPIPSVTQPAPEVYATPLPVLSMIVLSIVRLYLTSISSSLFKGFVLDSLGRIPVCERFHAIFVVHGQRRAYSPYLSIHFLSKVNVRFWKDHGRS